MKVVVVLFNVSHRGAEIRLKAGKVPSYALLHARSPCFPVVVSVVWQMSVFVPLFVEPQKVLADSVPPCVI